MEVTHEDLHAEYFFLSHADCMLQSMSLPSSPITITHGKRSPIGFDATFAKGGNRRNYISPETNIPLPSLGIDKVTMDSDDYDYISPISPAFYPVEYSPVVLGIKSGP